MSIKMSHIPKSVTLAANASLGYRSSYKRAVPRQRTPPGGSTKGREKEKPKVDSPQDGNPLRTQSDADCRLSGYETKSDFTDQKDCKNLDQGCKSDKYNYPCNNNNNVIPGNVQSSMIGENGQGCGLPQCVCKPGLLSHNKQCISDNTLSGLNHDDPLSAQSELIKGPRLIISPEPEKHRSPQPGAPFLNESSYAQCEESPERAIKSRVECKKAPESGVMPDVSPADTLPGLCNTTAGQQTHGNLYLSSSSSHLKIRRGSSEAGTALITDKQLSNMAEITDTPLDYSMKRRTVVEEDEGIDTTSLPLDSSTEICRTEPMDYDVPSIEDNGDDSGCITCNPDPLDLTKLKVNQSKDNEEYTGSARDLGISSLDESRSLELKRSLEDSNIGVNSGTTKESSKSYSAFSQDQLPPKKRKFLYEQDLHVTSGSVETSSKDLTSGFTTTCHSLPVDIITRRSSSAGPPSSQHAPGVFLDTSTVVTNSTLHPASTHGDRHIPWMPGNHHGVPFIRNHLGIPFLGNHLGYPYMVNPYENSLNGHPMQGPVITPSIVQTLTDNLQALNTTSKEDINSRSNNSSPFVNHITPGNPTHPAYSPSPNQPQASVMVPCPPDIDPRLLNLPHKTDQIFVSGPGTMSSCGLLSNQDTHFAPSNDRQMYTARGIHVLHPPGGTPNRLHSPGGTPNRLHSPGGTPNRLHSPGGTPNRLHSPGGSPKRLYSPGGASNQLHSPGGTSNRLHSPGGTVRSRESSPSSLPPRHESRNHKKGLKLNQENKRKTGSPLSNHSLLGIQNHHGDSTPLTGLQNLPSHHQQLPSNQSCPPRIPDQSPSLHPRDLTYLSSNQFLPSNQLTLPGNQFPYSNRAESPSNKFVVHGNHQSHQSPMLVPAVGERESNRSSPQSPPNQSTNHNSSKLQSDPSVQSANRSHLSPSPSKVQSDPSIQQSSPVNQSASRSGLSPSNQSPSDDASHHHGSSGPAENSKEKNSHDMALQADEDGDLPIHIAVVQSQPDAVSCLIKLMRRAKMSLDAFNNLKQTPLHLAVITKQDGIVKTLIHGGASPNTPDRKGLTCCHLAVNHKTPRCLQVILGQRKVKVKIDAKNYDGLTPLHRAVMTGNGECIDLLVNHGADINMVDGKSGKTPLYIAFECNQPEIADLLLSKGADVNIPTYSGSTVLQAANSRGQHLLNRLLSRPGPDGGKDVKVSGRGSKNKNKIPSSAAPRAMSLPHPYNETATATPRPSMAGYMNLNNRETASRSSEGSNLPLYLQQQVAMETTTNNANAMDVQISEPNHDAPMET